MKPPTPPAHAFAHPFVVAGADIDQLGHANNVVYVRWVQEAAAAHWQHLSPPGPTAPSAVWVVQEHLIRYHRPAYAGQALLARTWVADVQGARSRRLTRIERAGELLCTAETQWVLVEAGSGRPLRVPPEVAARLLAEAPAAEADQ